MTRANRAAHKPRLCAAETMYRQLTRRERATAATRQHVVQIAKLLFMERGFMEVGVRDIAEAMQMSTGAVFTHFASKDELFAVAMNTELPNNLLKAAPKMLDILREQLNTSGLSPKARTQIAQAVAIAEGRSA